MTDRYTRRTSNKIFEIIPLSKKYKLLIRSEKSKKFIDKTTRKNFKISRSDLSPKSIKIPA